MRLLKTPVIRLVSFLLAVLAFAAAAETLDRSSSESDYSLSVVPMPVSLVAGHGLFLFDSRTAIVIGAPELKAVATDFSQFFARASGLVLPVVSTAQEQPAITLLLAELASTNPEAYTLAVTEQGMTITANSVRGVFYGLQTVRQLLPPEVESAGPVNHRRWQVPAVTIVDEPRFPYRGMHLDVARSFMPVGFVKRYIDLLAFHKLNYFHWHLTDDQGWRLPIEGYPRLTSVAAWRDKTVVGHTLDRDTVYDNSPVGGFYTKAEIRDIVAYAQSRQITIVPEIDIPGHASAVLAAYPELGCEAQAASADTFVQPNFGIFPAVLCPTDKTFGFLKTVFTEVAELFPGEYMHVGGDEVLKTQWQASPFVSRLMAKEKLEDYHQVQSYFISQVAKIIAGLNRKMIGWNEILDGGIAADATIMSWQGIKGGIAAARLGHDAIMTPFAYTYFDFFQSHSVDEPMAIHGLTPLAKVYSYDPLPQELAGTDQARHILGAQGQLWTEYQTRPRDVEYMVLPRMSALAEVVWSQPARKNWPDYLRRLPDLFARYDAMSVTAARSVYAPTLQAERKGTGITAKYRVNASGIAGTRLHYTTDGSLPNSHSALYRKPVTLTGSALVRVRAQDPVSGRWYPESQLRLVAHKAVGAAVSVLTPSAGETEQAALALVDGVSQSDQIYQPSDWTIFYGDSAQIVIDLAKPQSISELAFAFNAGKHRQLYPPSAVTVWVSDDQQHWREVAVLDEKAASHLLNRVSLAFAKTRTRYIKVVAANNTTYLSNETGDRRKVPLHIDELLVN